MQLSPVKPSKAPSTHLPNPISTSRLKSLIDWLARPYDFLDECTDAYGDTFTANFFGFPPLVFLSNPQAIKEIFGNTSFNAGKNQDILRPLLGNNSLIVLDGDRHRSERKMLMPPFHGAKVKSYADTICQITKDLCEQWQPQQSLLANEAMPAITLEVILQTVFGLREGERYQQIKQLLISWISLTASPLSASLLFFKGLQKDLGPWSPWGKVLHQRQQIYELLQAEIEERRSFLTSGPGSSTKPKRDDMLSLMLMARDEDGQPMTDEALKDELITMLVAGHETTATMLCWALYWIHKLPDVKAKLMAELETLGKEPDPMEMAKLPYLTAVVSESLRMYPVAPIVSPRVTNKAITINGHTFPPDTCLTPCIYTVHHREDLYPDSKTFKPERFLERQFSSSEFIPFGGGSRRCIGYALAKLELNLVLATILRHRTLKLANDEPVKPRRKGVAIATSNGVPLVVVN